MDKCAIMELASFDNELITLRYEKQPYQ
jgi:hypothetical protein